MLMDQIKKNTTTVFIYFRCIAEICRLNFGNYFKTKTYDGALDFFKCETISKMNINFILMKENVAYLLFGNV